MDYAQINDHFKRRLLARIRKRLLSIPETKRGDHFNTLADFVLSLLVILADKNNLQAAAEEVYKFKLADSRTAVSMDAAMLLLTQAMEQYPTEFALLHDLFRMIDRKDDCADIIAEMEVRLIDNE